MKDAKKKIMMLILNDISDSNYKIRELESEKNYLNDRKQINGDVVEADLTALEYSVAYWERLKKESVELYAHINKTFKEV